MINIITLAAGIGALCYIFRLHRVIQLQNEYIQRHREMLRDKLIKAYREEARKDRE